MKQRLSQVRAMWTTIKLLYRVDRRSFLVSATTGLLEALFYPLLLLIMWNGFSLLLSGGGAGYGLYPQGVELVAALFAVLALQHLLRIINDTSTSILKVASAQHANTQMMRKMAEIPYQFFEENDFQARYGLLINQATYRPGLLVEMLISSMSTLAAFLSIIATLLALSPLVVVLLLGVIPLMAVETRFHKRTVELQTSSAGDMFRMQYLSQKSIDATWQRDIRVHRASLLEEEYQLLGQRYLHNLRRLLLHFQSRRAGVGIVVSGAVTLATGVVFWLIGHSSSGLAEVAILLPALYLGLTQGKSFAFSWGTLMECISYIEQVFTFLEQPFEQPTSSSMPAIAPVPSPLDTSAQDRMAIHLHKLGFKYPHAERSALSEISYTFTRGATAIVGPNGAGKSTLVKLLTGLLTPTSGWISAHLPDEECLTPEHLHKAVLFQEPSHLYLTIRQNITMRFEPTPGEDARIYEALEKAGLAKLVKGLPDGIDTLVGAGFGGQTDLSGGQWQRLALARLIYQDAPVIILDEPVASLDPQGERAVFELFAQLAQSRIILFTTHRYDSIPKDTKILVLVDGVIAESGTHEELLQKQHAYWSLYTA